MLVCGGDKVCWGVVTKVQSGGGVEPREKSKEKKGMLYRCNGRSNPGSRPRRRDQLVRSIGRADGRSGY